MKSFGYHNIQFRDGTEVDGPLVVEIDGNGCFLSWHPLLGEEAFVEWRGGTFKE